MDLEWLTAPESEVEANAATTDASEIKRPPWLRSRRRLLAHLSALLMLWYLAVASASLGGRVEARAEGFTLSDLVVVLVILAIFVLWAWGTIRLYTWADRPTRRFRIDAARANLTARANGYEPEPVRRVRFSSQIGGETRTAGAYPRFTGPDIEFGNLKARHNDLEWHYLAVSLPVPQPHLVLDAIGDGPLPSELPRLDPDQRIRLGGVFERTFHLYAPRAYATDALYLLTPDVMAVLIDHAAAYNIEIIDTHLIFFTPSFADFTDPGTWEALEALRRDAVPALMARAHRYRDQDVSRDEAETDQLTAKRRAAFRQALAELRPHRRHAPSIGPVGRRLQMRRRRITWPLVRTRLWYVLLFILYVTPVSIAFGALMSMLASLWPIHR